MSHKVFIVILNWNGATDTIECIKSVKNIFYNNYEILLVDNNSNINSFKKIISVFPEIQYIRNGENLGFAEGNNVGIRFALDKRAKYILLLNNDTIVEQNFLLPLVKYMEKNDDVGICGPTMCYYDKRDTIWQTGGIYSRFTGRFKMKYSDMPIESIKEEVIELDYVPGAGLLIKSDIIKHIGLLDKQFFNQCEDLDWGLKTKLMGKRVVCISNSVIYHKVSNSTPLSINSYFRYRNLLIIINKYSVTKLVSLTILFLSVFVNIFKHIRKGSFTTIKYIIYGIIDYYKNNLGKGRIFNLLITKN